MTDEHPTTSLPADPNGATLTFDGAVDAVRIESFGDYELTTEIARGGMGVVLRGRQIKLNRPVAVKMLLAGSFATATERERFRHEAEAAAGLTHPHILPVYEVGEHAGRAYFSMKLVDGGTLASLLKSQPRPGTQELVALLAKVCRAVDHAHRRGILHRDLKPSNVLLDADGTPFVADFGLAKRADSDDMLTRTGAVVGTPSYMAPEQARGEKGLSTAVDVYSLAAILYEILSGKPPFVAATPMATLRKVIDDAPANPRSHSTLADRDLSVVALKGLEKEPARRYSSAASLADDLERWLRGEPVTARATTKTERLLRWVRKNPIQAGLSASLAAALFFGTFFSIRYAVEAHKQKQAADDNLAGVQRMVKLTEDALAKANAEKLKAGDALCRSQFEEARALRLAGQPGWRFTSLNLLQESARLRRRDRGDADDKGLPSLADLRGETIAALLRADARPLRTLPSGVNDSPLLSGDGKLLISKFNRLAEGKMTFGFRGLHVDDGRQDFTHEVTVQSFIQDKEPTTEFKNTMDLFNSELSINSDGSRLLTNGRVATEIGIVDTKTAKEIKSLKFGKDDRARIASPCFSPDDSKVLAWRIGDKNTLTLALWDTNTDQPPRVLGTFAESTKKTRKGREIPSTPLCGFTPRGEVWYAAPDGTKLVVLDPQSEPVKSTTLAIASVLTVAWHPTLPRVAAIVKGPDQKPNQGHFVLWDTAGNKEVARRSGIPFVVDPDEQPFAHYGSSMAFRRDGRYIALPAGSSAIAVLDATTGREVLQFPIGALEGLQSLAWTARGDLLVKPQFEAVQVWTLDVDDATKRCVDCGAELKMKAISPDQRWLVAERYQSHGAAKPRPDVKSSEESVFLFEVATGTRRPLPAKPDVQQFRFRQDSKAVVFVDDGVVREFAIPDVRELRKFDSPSPPGFKVIDQAFYLADGRLVGLLRPDFEVPQKGNTGKRPYVLWDLSGQKRIPVQNALPPPRFAQRHGTHVAQSGKFVIANGNSMFGDSMIPLQGKAVREDWQVIGLPDGQLIHRIPHAIFGEGDVVSQTISPDERWLGVGTITLAAGGDLAIGGTTVQILSLPGGERVLRRDIRPSEEDVCAFAATLPIAAIQTDKSTLELWRLEPVAEPLARWQPYGSRRIADFGFLGDCLHLRADGSMELETLPLAALRARLKESGLDW